jgi:galactose mutarotase-like enzyme
MEISSRGIPIRLRRTLDLEKHRPVLRVHYTAENLGAAQESFLWAAHPLIAIEGGMSLVLPAGTQLVRSYATENCPIHVASDLAVLTDPLEGGSQSFALKAHAFLPATDRWAALRTAAGEELRVEFDSSEITCLAIWLNARAWSGCGSEPYFNLGFEPMIGAVDRLDVAVEKNLERGLLAPHGSSTWSFTLRLK